MRSDYQMKNEIIAREALDNTKYITSIEIAELTGKMHKHVMEAIRKMEPAWESERGTNFRLSQIRESLAAAELGAGDGGGDGHVEAVGRLTVVEIGDEQTAVDALTYGFGDAIALVAHDDEPLFCELLGVDVIAIEQGAVDGIVGGQRVEEGGKISIYNVHARNAAHRGLYHFGVPSIDSIFGTDDVGDAKPVGNADDGAQVARILDAIEGDGEGAQLRGNPIGDREEG